MISTTCLGFYRLDEIRELECAKILVYDTMRWQKPRSGAGLRRLWSTESADYRWVSSMAFSV